MKRYSMHFDSLWGIVKPTEDTSGAWVPAKDIIGRGKADAQRIRALEADLATARHEIRNLSKRETAREGDT